MKIALEFDQLDTPFDMQFGDWLPGTSVSPTAVLHIPQDLTLEEQAQARKNIGAMQNGLADTTLDMNKHSLSNVHGLTMPSRSGKSGYIELYATGGEEDGDECLEFDSVNGNPRISGLGDGINDNDAATVGQLNAATEKYVIPLLRDTYGGFHIDPEFNFNWDEMVSAIQKGVPVFCLSQKDYSGLVRKFTLADLEADGGYATFSCTHYYTDSHQYRAFTIYRDGSTRNDSSSPDKTLTKYNVPADAHAVGKRFEQVESDLENKQDIANRVTTIDENSDDAHYPTAKAVRDHVAAEKYVIPLVASVDAKYFSIDPEFNFNWDEMVSAIQKGVPVFCLSKKNDNGLVRKFMLADLEADGGYVSFSCAEFYLGYHKNHSFVIYTDGSTRYESVTTDKTLSRLMAPADAKAVGDRFKQVESSLENKQDIADRVTIIDENADDEHYPTAKAVYDQVAKQGFVKLAETILTEDAVEIVWTQTQDGKPLSDYKDFFIYWTGKFTADVGANNSTNSRFQCRGNGGIMYFCCQFPAKNSTTNHAGWFYIEEITNDGNFALWKSQFPNAFLNTGNGANIDYKVQGLPEACRTTVTDICCITNPAHTTLQKLHLGNTPESTSIFAAGTKAILYGRAR